MRERKFMKWKVGFGFCRRSLFDPMFRNVDKGLPFRTALYPRRTQISYTPQFTVFNLEILGNFVKTAKGQKVLFINLEASCVICRILQRIIINCMHE
jgi:hypothetical protein